MTGRLLAEFGDPAALRGAARNVRQRGHRPLDAFTPFPLQDLDEVLGIRPSRIRYAMAAGGILTGIFMFALQWYSAVVDYPLNSGGRPLNSWPVFLLVPFEFGVFVAALAGFVALLWGCGLPCLHHPIFEVPGVERASEDRFFLLAQPCAEDQHGLALRHLLEEAGALVVTGVLER